MCAHRACGRGGLHAALKHPNLLGPKVSTLGDMHEDEAAALFL
ncbi:MAG: hypothetical protein ACTSYB_10910 [Candidatus Helarchaeota archaeon]